MIIEVQRNPDRGRTLSMLIDRQYPEMTPYSVPQGVFNDNKARKQRNANGGGWKKNRD